MRYYLNINGNDYYIPTPISDINPDLFEKYTLEYDNKLYLDLDKLISEDKRKEVRLITDQCTSTVGMIVMEDELELKQFNEMGSKIRLYSDLSQMAFEKRDKIKGYNNIKKELELVLSYYTELMKQDETKIKGR